MPARLPPHAQRGTALIVALIVLVVLTLLGLSGMRIVTLEERMTANTFDRALAFQAAEAALRNGELQARGHGFDDDAWQALDVAALIDAEANPDAVRPPGTLEYLVERLESPEGGFPCDVNELSTGERNCERYRITARSHEDSRAGVELQTIYVVRP